MSNAILRITDGTTTIDLINETNGFLLDDWRPAVSEYKGGGTFQDTPLADGRQLVDRRYSNVIETMTLNVRNVTQDTVIHDTQELRRLLEKASAYWSSDWTDEPVWIEARAPTETNTRYSVIMTGRLAEDQKPYGQPFMQEGCSAAMIGLTLLLEREPFWRATQPGTGTAIALSAVESYDSRNYGNVSDASGPGAQARDPSTVDGTVFVANKRAEANLSDAYLWDSGGGGWSGNLQAWLAMSFGLLAGSGNGDLVVFGIDTALADSGPFSNIVFDLLTAAGGVNLTNITWTYWNGAWAALTVQDNTDADGNMTGFAFDTTGVRSMCFEPPTDWAAVALNATGLPAAAPAITGYWIKAEVSATGAYTAPVQQTTVPYSTIWPYTQVQSAAVLGGLAESIRLRIWNQSDNDGASAPATWSNRVIAGLRSTSRGTNFTAYLNLADEQNPTNVSVSVAGTGAFANFVRSPTGRIITATPAAGGFVDTVQVNINNPLSSEYTGAYHGFLRLEVVAGGTPANIDARVRAIYGSVPQSVIYQSEILTMDASAADSVDVLDLGKLSLPDYVSGVGVTSFAFVIALQGDGATQVRLFDLILIPVDEFALEALDTVRSNTGAYLGGRRSTEGRYLDIDPITKPKRIEVLLKDHNDDNVRIRYRYIAPGGTPILQANTTQRLWFFQTANNGTDEVGDLWTVDTLLVDGVQRYFSLRGDR